MEELLVKVGEEIEILESIYADDGVIESMPEVQVLDKGEEEKASVVKVVLNFTPNTGLAQEKIACTMRLALLFSANVSSLELNF